MNTKISEASQVLREMEAGAVAMLPDPAPDVIGGWAQRLRAALPRLHPQPAELAEQQGVDMADADTVALEIARRFIPVDSPGAHNEGQQRAALQVAIVGAINAALAATGKQQVGEARPCAAHCQSGRPDVCLASQRDDITCPHDSCDIDDGVRHNHLVAAKQVGEVQGDARATIIAALEDSQPVCNDSNRSERLSRHNAALAYARALAARQPGAQEPVRTEFAISRTMEDAEAASDGMLPAALVPVADEWYRLCERRFAVDRIRISGKLAEAIVDAVCAAPPAQGIDLGPLSRLYAAYVRLLESGRDRIIDLGGTCDPVDVMERMDADLIEARNLIGQRDAAPGVQGTWKDHLLDRRNRLMNSYGNGDREDAAIDAQIAQVDAELAVIDGRDAVPGVGNG